MSKQIKTSELTGAALDWAVAKCEEPDDKRLTVIRHEDYIGQPVRRETECGSDVYERWSPSRIWAQGGPIIERKIHKLFRNVGGTWSAMILKDVPLTPEERGTGLALTRREQHNGSGSSPLIAAMRCYVASKLGDTVEVPDELLS